MFLKIIALGVSALCLLFLVTTNYHVQMTLTGIDVKKNYVCQTFNGRLANHIFQYASIYGIASLNNLTILLANDDDLVEYFKVPSALRVRSRKVCDYFIKMSAKHCCTFEPSFMKLQPNQNYKLGVYLQSWRFFGHVKDLVRNELRFHDDIHRYSVGVVESYRRKNIIENRTSKVTVVGVHIRRGDIASKEFLEANSVVLAPDQYIHNAIDYFLKHFENVIFLVCTDGMDYAKKIMAYRGVTVMFSYGTAIQDLATLSSCDHVLTTVGSFGWWAGFLSNGTVTYYKYPMREGTFERREYNYDDFFLPEWVGLE